MQVHFRDPRSPWQRGRNENTNGLLRQYLPKNVDFAPATQEQLDAIARELDTRPRETLDSATPAQALSADWATPAQALSAIVATMPRDQGSNSRCAPRATLAALLDAAWRTDLT